MNHAQAIEFRYTNYRGEISFRKAVVIGIRWGSTEWHPEEGLLLEAFDLDKQELREFALKDCDFTANKEKVEQSLNSDEIRQRVEKAARELKRQYEEVGGCVNWYNENRKSDGTLDWVAVDGNPDLTKLVEVILS